MADRSKAAALEALVHDLSEATVGSTFNQFRETGPDDLPGAPAIRIANLLRYLEERREADVVAIGEAAGYQGMRWSGIAFTSEFDLLRWGDPYRRTSRRQRPWREPSGSIVHGTLEGLDAERRVILWNTVPTHPHEPEKPLSNRRPLSQEIALGKVFADRLLSIIKPQTVVGVGRIACAAFSQAIYVRHPAQSGATAFRLGMRQVLSGTKKEATP